MFRILCIFAMWIGWSSYHLTRALQQPFHIFNVLDVLNVGERMNTTRSKVFGKGINDYPSTVQNNRKKMPSYNKWRSMLQRCYDEKFILKHASYMGCSVCDEWLHFTNFDKWYNENYVQGYQLDKDLILKGNKHYCPEYCCFVPQEINELIIKCEARRGAYPLGVEKKGNKFRARSSFNGADKTIGYFDTSEEAFQAYKEAKEAYIKEVATQYYNDGKITEKVYDALMRYEIEITD